MDTPNSLNQDNINLPNAMAFSNEYSRHPFRRLAFFNFHKTPLDTTLCRRQLSDLIHSIPRQLAILCALHQDRLSFFQY